MGNSQAKMYLLGSGISHSKSPAFWADLFKEKGLDWTYELADIADEVDARRFIEDRDFCAINITTPWKKIAFELADERLGASTFCGGCNFLVKKGISLEGYNVDGQGCVNDLKSKGVDFDNLCVVVCGTGPTAKSIAFAATLAGAIVIMLTRDASKKIAFKLNGREVMVLDYKSARHEIGYAKLIINATTLGMEKGDPSPVDKSLLNEGHIVYDCIYGHGQTQIRVDAAAAGACSYDGAGMLNAQAKACADLLF